MEAAQRPRQELETCVQGMHLCVKVENNMFVFFVLYKKKLKCILSSLPIHCILVTVDVEGL